MLSETDSQRIVAHMNDDHADALRRYARVYGDMSGVQEATMLDLDAEAMVLRVAHEEGEDTVRIALDRRIGTAEEAREVLVDMALRARSTDP